MDPEIKSLLIILLESQNNLTTQLSNLATITEEFITSSQQRIVFVEKQLDILISSITINQPKNGKVSEE